MIEYAGDITRQDIKDVIESMLPWPRINRAECQVVVSVDSKFVPHIHMDCPIGSGMSVEFETHKLIDDDGNEGYEFIPTIINSSHRYEVDLDNMHSVVPFYRKQKDAAELAIDIYKIEFFPAEWFD